MARNRKYEVELWINNRQVADISQLATDRRFTIKRNDVEDFSFNLDVAAFEDYCRSVKTKPVAILEPYVTDVRLKKDGQYIFGVQVVDMEYTFNESGASLNVQCLGFLNLFKDRYVTKNYTQVDAADIARDLINETQTEDPLNDFGVTNGLSQFDTGVLRDRSYADQNVKDGIINLTNLVDGNFDFRFNYDRTFETFGYLGSDQSTRFTYPYNIKSLTVPHTAMNMYNYIIALGSGFGEETLRSEVADRQSRLNYGTHQKIVTFNSVSLQDTLDQNAVGYLLSTKDILELPSLTVSGKYLDLNQFSVGDRILVEVLGHPTMPLSGKYRIEQISCTIDENDSEDIALTVDNLYVYEQ